MLNGEKLIKGKEYVGNNLSFEGEYVNRKWRKGKLYNNKGEIEF